MTDFCEIAREEGFTGYNRQGIHNYIDASVCLGLGVKVWHYARVLADVQLGLCCSIGGGTEIGRGSVIGAHSRIGANCFLPPNSKVGDHVFIGPSTTFCDDKHPYVHGPDDPPYNAQPPVIEDYASIGASCVVLPGVRIGRHAVVGAGSVVTRDVPPHGVVYGEPARLKSA